MSIPESNQISFIGKDDGEEKQIAFVIEGKHGQIGIIRSNKPATINDKKVFLETLAEVAIRGVVNEKKEEAI
ncbi:hypothetical protein [Paenibacillus sp. L3-i20]|uniref:hypothetical protein n=1 Tax=Paenibacillus sp. L3-i20 TaxID=2905833 RepID=UPI001EDDF2BF|nr:hypothetical protein [Paenibacillus sp. L3-i20]GKU79796.1 hypothetical protein L3i20_v241930 [Paenibacillus sp. L3-i20]